MNNLSNVTNEDRYIKGVLAGKSYSATLSGDTSNLSVKIGGTDVASSVFDSSASEITISSVTSDIVIGDNAG